MDDKRDIEEENKRRKGMNSFHVYLPKMNLRLPEAPIRLSYLERKVFSIIELIHSSS